MKTYVSPSTVLLMELKFSKILKILTNLRLSLSKHKPTALYVIIKPNANLFVVKRRYVTIICRPTHLSSFSVEIPYARRTRDVKLPKATDTRTLLHSFFRHIVVTALFG